MIVADTGAVVSLMNARDRWHPQMRELYLADPGSWVLPWAILPEVDYLVATRASRRASALFLDDLAGGQYQVEWGRDEDLQRARELTARYRSLEIGLVDAVVMAVAERLHARAIATLDLRHFGAVELRGQPALLPRDRG